MNKHLLLILLGFGSFGVVAYEDDSITRTALFCEYIKNIYHPMPTYENEAWGDESIIISDVGDSVEWLWIDMYGFRYKADKNNTVINWTANDQNFEKWEYKHTLNRYTGNLIIEHHVPIAENSSQNLKNLDFDGDGIIIQTTYYFSCKKSEALF